MMTRDEIFNEMVKLPALHSHNDAVAATEGALWMQEQIDHAVCDANEAGELLAYNCEKRARKETIDKAVELFRSTLKAVNKGFGEGVFDVEIYTANYRKILESK